MIQIEAFIKALVDAGTINAQLAARILEYTVDEIDILTIEKERAKGITNTNQDGVLADIDARRKGRTI